MDALLPSFWMARLCLCGLCWKGRYPFCLHSSLLCRFRHVTWCSPGLVSSFQINKASSWSLWPNLSSPVFNNTAGTECYQNPAPDCAWALILMAARSWLRTVPQARKISPVFYHYPFAYSSIMLCPALADKWLCGLSPTTPPASRYKLMYWYLEKPKPHPISLFFPTRRCFGTERAPFFPCIQHPCGWHTCAIPLFRCSWEQSPALSPLTNIILWGQQHVTTAAYCFSEPLQGLYQAIWISIQHSYTALQLS